MSTSHGRLSKSNTGVRRQDDEIESLRKEIEMNKQKIDALAKTIAAKNEEIS